MGALQQRTLISQGSGGCKSEVRVLRDLVSGEDPLPGLQMVKLSVPPWPQKRKQRLGPSVVGRGERGRWSGRERECRGAAGGREDLCHLLRVLIPFTRTPPSRPNYFPQAPCPGTITLGNRVSIYGLFGGGHKHGVHSRCFSSAVIPRSLQHGPCGPLLLSLWGLPVGFL